MKVFQILYNQKNYVTVRFIYNITAIISCKQEFSILF